LLCVKRQWREEGFGQSIKSYRTRAQGSAANSFARLANHGVCTCIARPAGRSPNTEATMDAAVAFMLAN
jgi:hypothetical protein